MLTIGALPEVQTIIFRGADRYTLATTLAAKKTFTIAVGAETTGNILYGAPSIALKTALEALHSVNKVTVQRQGDGVSSSSYFGYSYTITFWGEYGLNAIPQIVVSAVIPNVSYAVDTLHQMDRLADHNTRYEV